MGELAVQSVSDSYYIDLYGECFDDVAMADGRVVVLDEYAPVVSDSLPLGCASPSWQPLHNCGFAQEAPLPEKFFEPWTFRHTDTVFFKSLDVKLSGLTSVTEKAQAIVTAASELTWRFQAQPTGKSPDQLLMQAKGNCTDATNFLYALFLHYDIPAAPIYILRTQSDQPDHVAVEVYGEEKNYLADLTLKPNSWDVSSSDWNTLTDREFAALFFNGMGVGWNEQNFTPSAKTYFDVAHELCPDLGSSLVNGAELAMQGTSPDLTKARQLLNEAAKIGYLSAEDYAAEMRYAILVGDQAAYSKFDSVLTAICPTHPELETSFSD